MKIVSRTSRIDNYGKIKEVIRQVQEGKFNDMTLEQVLDQLLHRKVGDRMIRVCTPMERMRDDEIASPKAKNYDDMDAPEKS